MQREEAEILTFLKLDIRLLFFRGKKYDKLHHAPCWGGMTMSVSCNIFMIFIDGECKLLKRVFKEILWLQRILVSSAISVKTHNTVFHIHKSFCTLYMSTASLRTLQMVLELHIPLSIFCFVVVSNGLLSDITSFNLQTESNSLIEHNVSAAWCQWISKCVFFLVNFHNIYGKFTF